MVERRTGLRSARTIGLATVAGIALTVVLRIAHEHVSPWYLPLLFAAGATLVVLLRGTHADPSTPPPLVHGAPADPRPELVAVRALEGRVERATREPRWFEERLRPELLELARLRAGIAVADTDDIKDVIGEDAWAWLRPGTRPRAPTPRELDLLIGRIETLQPRR